MITLLEILDIAASLGCKCIDNDSARDILHVIAKEYAEESRKKNNRMSIADQYRFADKAIKSNCKCFKRTSKKAAASSSA